MFESWKTPKEEEPEEGGAAEGPIIEDPDAEDAERKMSAASADAVADLEQQLGAGDELPPVNPDAPPVLSDEDAEAKLKKNTEDQMYSAAEKRQAKE